MYLDRAEPLTIAPEAPPDPVSNRVGPRHGWYIPVKTLVEWMAALVLLAATLPLMLILAALVRLTSPGPAFYAQSRVGRNGRIFLMYKLRTMRHRCEVETGPIWSPPNDSRVTSLGRILRKTHLDELPQFVNVIQGNMSLIGPRPERPELVASIEKSIPRFRERLALRPGMTGLAQCQLPSDLGLHTVSRKLAYDLYYVRAVNPWLDLRIVLGTAFYLLGAIAHALGRRMVSPYGQAAERDHEWEEMDDEEDCQTQPG